MERDTFTHPFLTATGSLKSLEQVNADQAKARAQSGMENWGSEWMTFFFLDDVSPEEYAEEVELLRSRNRISGEP